MRVWNADIGQEQLTIQGTDFFYSVAFSPDSKRIVSGRSDNTDGTSMVWDAETGQMIRLYTGHTDQVGGVAFSSDGKYVLTSSDDGTARMWTAANEAGARIFSANTDEIYEAAFSPDGIFVLTGGAEERKWSRTLLLIVSF